MSQGRREEFTDFVADPGQLPDPRSSAAFERSKLDWDERATAPHADLLDWHRRLIRLRRSLPGLTSSYEATRESYDEDARWLAMQRGAVTGACNLAAQLQCVPLTARGCELLLASAAGVRLTGDGVELPPESAVIIDC